MQRWTKKRRATPNNPSNLWSLRKDQYPLFANYHFAPLTPDPISFYRKLSPPKRSHIWKVSHIPGRTSLSSGDVSSRSSQSESGVYKRSVISSFRFFSYHRKSESMFSNSTNAVRNLAGSLNGLVPLPHSAVRQYQQGSVPAGNRSLTLLLDKRNKMNQLRHFLQVVRCYLLRFSPLPILKIVESGSWLDYPTRLSNLTSTNVI